MGLSGKSEETSLTIIEESETSKKIRTDREADDRVQIHSLVEQVLKIHMSKDAVCTHVRTLSKEAAYRGR